MKIILVRHGEPQINKTVALSSSDFLEWTTNYDMAGLKHDSIASHELITLANTARYFVSSDLLRAIESIRKLTKTEVFNNALFNEVPLPIFNLPWLRINANKWCVLYRIFWLLGHSKNTESYQNANHRAKKASNFLINCAKKHDNVLLMGHGIFNRLIAKCLNSLGWKRSICQGYKYWGYSIFQPYKIISGDNVE